MSESAWEEMTCLFAPSLVSLAGEGYFSLIKDQFRNFGLQNLLCHYLMSYEGREVLNTILINLSDYRNVDILANMSQFGVFISCRGNPPIFWSTQK
ncbi:hypothetical protein ACMGG4_00200 [Citrobacter sp. BNK-40]|uniref:hypothetical protein n=1 Tax=Citrobacter sp. BNK-40 TaxID=3376173 RepID=UPI003B5152C3